MKNTFFSILIPCYGDAKYLEETIDSIFSQAYRNFEIIICFQGNTTIPEIIKKKKKIKYFTLKTPSPYLSRIELYKRATGEYVWFVDDDDKIFKNSLQVLENILFNKKYDCLIFNKLDISEQTKIEDIYQKIKLPQSQEISKKDTLFSLISTNDLNSIWGKIFRNHLKPIWIEGNFYQSEDKLLNYSLINSCKKIGKFDYPLYLYFYKRGSRPEGLTSNRLADYILVRKIIMNLEPTYEKYLLSDILDAIISSIFTNKMKDFDKNLKIHVKPKTAKLLIKEVNFKKKCLYRLAINKKYRLIKFIGILSYRKKI